MSGLWLDTLKGRVRKLVPYMKGMEDTIKHMPMSEMRASVRRGWWLVEVRVGDQDQWYAGKKDRSYFSAMAKALDAAMKATHC